MVDAEAPTVADATQPLLPGDMAAVRRVEQIGRFRVDGSLGAGGMGEVYRAYDPVLERAVALKVLRTKRDGDEAQRRRRILREARAAAGLAHPNTVTIFEVGEADGEVFIAMELLDGESLRDAFDRLPPLETKLRWLLEAARALAEAHGHGLVHRDVKPDNMFVCKGGALKLLDFGIAKRDEDEAPRSTSSGSDGSYGPSSMRTVEGRTLGTPRYMAPEQRASAPTDLRTDQYAWGLVAFELLTGEHALGGVATVNENEGAPGAPADQSPCIDALLAVSGLSPEIARAIARALAVRKEDRFASMAPIVALLETDASVPEQAPAAEAEPPARPRSRRAAVIVIGAVFAIGAVVTSVRVMEQRKRVSADPAAARSSSSASAKQAGPQCRAEPKRAYRFDPNDHLAVLPGGGLVLQRLGMPPRPDRYEREKEGHLEPFDPLGGIALSQPAMFGVPIEGQPGLVFIDPMGGMSAALWRQGLGLVAAQRIGKGIDGMAVASLGDAVVVVVSGPANAPENGWISTTVLGRGVPAGVVTVKTGEFFRFPAVAATKERIAVTFAGTSLYFAWLDRTGHVAGDILTVLSDSGPSTVGFAGDSPIVLWVMQVGAATRIYSAMMRADGSSFATPVIANDQPAAVVTPLAARLVDGTFAVFWVAVVGGKQVVRLAHLDSAGAMRRPIDVAIGGVVRDLTWSTTPTGGDLAWVDDATHEAVVARISCLL